MNKNVVCLRLFSAFLAGVTIYCGAVLAMVQAETPVEKAEVAAKQATAEKALAEQTAAADTAARKLLAEKAFAAMMGMRQSQAQKADAEKLLAEKRAALEQATAAQSAADQATAAAAQEKAAAESVLGEKSAATKAASEKLSAEQDANTKTALQEVATKAEADRVAAEKALAEKASSAQAAADHAAAVKAASEKAAAATTAAEQAVAQKTAAIPTAMDVAAAEEAAAMGALKPITATQWDHAKARHLLFRAGFGGPPAEVEKLHAMGLHAAVDYLVDYHNQPPCGVLVEVRRLERPRGYEQYLDGSERNDLSNERTNREYAQQAPLRQWWLRRMVETPRPLEEKLVLFWHDHFATGYEDKLYNSHVLYKQNQLFREYADQYDALLRGIIHDAAMIIYLDNPANIKGQGNENLGREVVELFSLGRDQGYTENDLRELSRALTGIPSEPALGEKFPLVECIT